MKTLEQFIKDNEGKFLEVAGSANAKFQCVDCVNGYIRDVLGFPIIEHTNAIDFKNKANGNYDIIYNDINNPNLVPDVGNIVVYKHPNKIGHIGVCIKKGVASTFGIFEENWPVGSPCKSVLNKKYILGDYVVDYWMRPKIINSNETMLTENETRILEFVRENKITEGQVRKGFGYITDNIEKVVQDLKDKITNLNDKIGNLSGQFLSDGKSALDWQKAYDSASAEVQTWKKKSLQASTFGQIIVELFNRIKSLIKK